MKTKVSFLIIVIVVVSMVIGLSYFSKWFSKDDIILKEPKSVNGVKILFLHHSTGQNIWNGGVEEWFSEYNKKNNTDYEIVEQDFPKKSPYGWNNYPFDYWNIWVNHAGSEPYKDEPTLEMITEKYDVVIWKHCFPVGKIEVDTGNPDISSDVKSLENYKLQYISLKDKMKKFNQTKFIIWTIPVVWISKFPKKILIIYLPKLELTITLFMILLLM